jgi:hypothetical protein
MDRNTEVERVSTGDGVAARPAGNVAVTDTPASTDTRIVPDRSDNTTGEYGYASRHADIGAKGEQFILANWATLVAGLWVLIAPFVLTYADTVTRARANDLTLGMVIATMAATRIFGNYRSGRLNSIISALCVLPGLWLIASPFIFSYQDMTRPMWSDIISGVAVVVFSIWAYMTSRHDDDDD